MSKPDFSKTQTIHNKSINNLYYSASNSYCLTDTHLSYFIQEIRNESTKITKVLNYIYPISIHQNYIHYTTQSRQNKEENALHSAKCC